MSARRAGDAPVNFPGIPDGISAFPVSTWRETDDSGPVEVRTPRGRRKLEEVELRAAADSSSPSTPLPPPLSPLSGAGAGAGEETFLLAAGRRQWATIADRYGETAFGRACELVRSGHVVLRCQVDPGPRLGEPIAWQLSAAVEARRAEHMEGRVHRTAGWQARADRATASVGTVCPELAAALRGARPGTRTLPVLTSAAEDLLAGVEHAGPRAFSQSHFGDTKARDDAAVVLRTAGVPESVIARLGLRRSARIGLAGPILVRTASGPIDLSVFDGPVLLRADQTSLQASLGPTGTLAVVENLQAAESVADRVPGLAIVYTAGVPGTAALGIIGDLATAAETTVICCDADPGGVRISDRLLSVCDGATVVDVGEYPHERRPAWAPDGEAVRALRAALASRAAAFARACLERGYPVEQEAPIVDALTSIDAVRDLARHPRDD